MLYVTTKKAHSLSPRSVAAQHYFLICQNKIFIIRWLSGLGDCSPSPSAPWKKHCNLRERKHFCCHKKISIDIVAHSSFLWRRRLTNYPRHSFVSRIIKYFLFLASSRESVLKFAKAFAHLEKISSRCCRLSKWLLLLCVFPGRIKFKSSWFLCLSQSEFYDVMLRATGIIDLTRKAHETQRKIPSHHLLLLQGANIEAMISYLWCRQFVDFK